MIRQWFRLLFRPSSGCPECGGSGYIDAPTSLLCYPLWQKHCPECKGLGKIKAKPKP